MNNERMKLYGPDHKIVMPIDGTAFCQCHCRPKAQFHDTSPYEYSFVHILIKVFMTLILMNGANFPIMRNDDHENMT